MKSFPEQKNEQRIDLPTEGSNNRILLFGFISYPKFWYLISIRVTTAISCETYLFEHYPTGLQKIYSCKIS
jgi:hypothetical protein